MLVNSPWAILVGTVPSSAWRTAGIWLLLRNVLRYNDKRNISRCLDVIMHLEKGKAVESIAVRWSHHTDIPGRPQFTNTRKIYISSFFLNAIWISKRSYAYSVVDLHIITLWMPYHTVWILTIRVLMILPLHWKDGQLYETVVTTSRWHLSARAIF